MQQIPIAQQIPIMQQIPMQQRYFATFGCYATDTCEDLNNYWKKYKKFVYLNFHDYKITGIA